MTVRVYQSTDTGAPQLSNMAGGLIALLDACLVNGYDVKAGAGWTKPFSGTNLAAYQQGAGSSGHYLRVDDTGTNYARAVGYESMTDVNTGVGPFPTETQRAGGAYWHKSSSGNRPWIVVADERTFYFHVEVSGSTSSAHLYMFGDITSYKSNDAFCTLFVCADGTSTSAPAFHAQSGTLTSPGAGSEYMPRSYTELGGSVRVGRHTDFIKTSNNTYFGVSGLIYPSPVDGGLYMAPIWVHHDLVIRGECRGAWAPLHTRPLTHGDTFQGTGPLTGKTFLMLYGYSSGSVFIETSDTW